MKFSDLVGKLCAVEGKPLPNRDPETGVAYGVADGPDVPEWFWDEAEPYSPLCCPSCGELLDEGKFDPDSDSPCPSCGHIEDDPSEWYSEPTSWYIDSPDLVAESSREGTVVMVYRSSRIVECRECSPCYPCAGDLSTIGEGNVRTYGFPEDEEEVKDE